jgi:hypothetical protein
VTESTERYDAVLDIVTEAMQHAKEGRHIGLRSHDATEAIMDLISQEVRAAECADCQQVHSFHASSPFEALSAEAP